METVVITGSTRGIGYGLAESFLGLGCAVVVGGRSASTTEAATTKLSSQYGSERVYGCPCDVRDLDQVKGLWAAAAQQYGKVDCWINNAGIGPTGLRFWEQGAQDIRAAVDVNLVGTMNGCAVAIPAMLDQGHGSVYNMEGLGSDGRQARGSALYGCTKSAIAYLTKGLANEVEGSPVIVGSLSPGMVITDLLTGQFRKESSDWESAKRIFNILADRVETVTPWLAEKALLNTKNGARIQWLSKAKIAWRFLSSPFQKRDMFPDDATTSA